MAPDKKPERETGAEPAKRPAPRRTSKKAGGGRGARGNGSSGAPAVVDPELCGRLARALSDIDRRLEDEDERSRVAARRGTPGERGGAARASCSSLQMMLEPDFGAAVAIAGGLVNTHRSTLVAVLLDDNRRAAFTDNVQRLLVRSGAGARVAAWVGRMVDDIDASAALPENGDLVDLGSIENLRTGVCSAAGGDPATGRFSSLGRWRASVGAGLAGGAMLASGAPEELPGVRALPEFDRAVSCLLGSALIRRAI